MLYIQMKLQFYKNSSIQFAVDCIKNDFIRRRFKKKKRIEREGKLEKMYDAILNIKFYLYVTYLIDISFVGYQFQKSIVSSCFINSAN